MKFYRLLFLMICLTCLQVHAAAQNRIVVFQTDFGLKDGAVAAMKGVAMSVSPNLKLFDLTHEIPPYNIWEAAYRLQQAASYWPRGTVFVSVVDPGVGSQRKSVVLKTRSGHFFVTPDNGTLTLVAESLGIESLREIDEKLNRLKNSGKSYTFHGRDVYAYTGARLAAGTISFEQVGPLLPNKVISIPYQKPAFQSGILKGSIPILDIQYGNVWTNINDSIFSLLALKFGDGIRVRILHQDKLIFEGAIPYVASFSSVPPGKELCYLNSLLNLSFALNQGNFSEKYRVASGPEWSVEILKQP